MAAIDCLSNLCGELVELQSGKQGKPVQVLQICKQCVGAHTISFCLLGHYPKPFEFFIIHFEEATPLANN